MVRAAVGWWRPSTSPTWLAPRHRREESDLARAQNGRVAPDMRLVDRSADHLRILERVGIFLAAMAEPRHEIGDRRDARRRLDLLLGLADALAHPGEIAKLQRSILGQMTHAGAEIVPASVQRQQCRQPEQGEPDRRYDRHNRIARLAGDEEPDGDELQRRLPFGELRHRYADAQLGEIFTQTRDQNLAAANDDRRPQRPAAD